MGEPCVVIVSSKMCEKNPIISAAVIVQFQYAIIKKGIIQKIVWPYPLCEFSILSRMSGNTAIQHAKKSPNSILFILNRNANIMKNSMAPAMCV